MKIIPFTATAVLAMFALTLAIGAAEQPIRPKQAEFFEKKIRPVLVKHCYECHSAKSKKVEGELLLDTREGIRAGGETGHGVVPGNIDDSLVIEALRHDGLEMPPEKKLPDAVIVNFQRWVRMGAPDPRGGKTRVVRNPIDLEKAREFWSFKRPVKSEVPAVKQSDWPRDELDRFILAGLEKADLKPVADADRRTLVRRIYFDLIGLPPSREEVQQAVDDRSPEAIEKVVDRLLDSPRFGERWGRHWLDVVRYGESTGMERNFTYPQAWRYRDYVIAAFNDDVPYDQFIREQLSGDLLAAELSEDEDPAERDRLLIATGMLAIGPKSLNERRKEKFLMDIVDEQIDVTSRAFLGLTASCARCHDHKFDPIAMQEYYALAGIFRSTEPFYGTGGGNGNRQRGTLLALSGGDPEEAKQFAAHQQQLSGLSDELRKMQRQIKRLRNQGAGKAAKNKPKKKRKGKGKGKGKNMGNGPAGPNNPQQQIRQRRNRIKQIQVQLRELRKSSPGAPPLAMGVRDRGAPADTRLRRRGDFDELGEVIPRGFLMVISHKKTPAIATRQSGRRELADWIASGENPLTARVMVNRIWQHLFGRGLVRTVNNFGQTGDRTSHNALLDHLAIRFMDEQWSVKRMIRNIVLSRTYQLSSHPDQKNIAADPENKLLWRMSQRRLDAEVMRDAILSGSGQLDLTPPDGSIVTAIGDGDIGRNIKPAQFAADDVHRSVYLPIVRGVVPEMLQVFDFPEPSIIGGQRDVTTVPTQALYMMNSPFVIRQSARMASRLLSDGEMKDDAARVTRAYEWIFSRSPQAAESDRALKYLATAEAALAGSQSDQQKRRASAWASLCQAFFASAEFRYLD